MREQLDIFVEAARARRYDPATSHLAASQVNGFAHHHNDLIVRALKDYGPATVSELAAVTGLAEQQVNKRLPECKRRGVVGLLMVDGAVALRRGASGAKQRVWTAI